MGPLPDPFAVGMGVPNELMPDYGMPMSSQRWDIAMTGFETEFGGYDLRALTDVIEPYAGNIDWRPTSQ